MEFQLQLLSRRGAYQKRGHFLTSFSFLLFSKTLLALIKISIGGVNEGAAALKFSNFS